MSINYLYVFAQYEVFKIGITANVSRRLSQHQSSNPHPIDLSGISYGREGEVLSVEKRVKRELEAVSGDEWFSLDYYDEMCSIVLESTLVSVSLDSSNLREMALDAREVERQASKAEGEEVIRKAINSMTEKRAEIKRSLPPVDRVFLNFKSLRVVPCPDSESTLV